MSRVCLQRQVVMLLGWIRHLLACKLLKGPDHAEPGVARLDHVIDVAVACGLVRVAEQVVVLFLLLLCHASADGHA